MQLWDFFDKLKKSVVKSKLIKSATLKAQSGFLEPAVNEIFDFYKTDDAFTSIIEHFNATPKDIESIIQGLMFSGAGGTYRGHFVPVSSVLFHDTLSYLLRSERGQVPKAQAYFEIQDYFRSGGVVFEPERRFH